MPIATKWIVFWVVDAIATSVVAYYVARHLANRELAARNPS